MASPVTVGMASPLLLLFAVALSLLPGGAPDLAADTAALLSFRAAVGRSVVDWNASTLPCVWQGVVCNTARTRVLVLRLPGVGLMGQIPPATIGNLTALRTLSLRFNALSGPLPADFTGLSELRNLYLQVNRFSGVIPSGISGLKNLVRLNLAGNQFSGGIPSELGKLARLGTLFLENNRLTGNIPPLDQPSLAQFNVSYNQLNGSIPQKLRSMLASAFIDTGLCGGPLGPCPGEISPSPSAVAPSGQNPSGGEVNGKRHKLSGGAIAGIAIGAVVFAVIVLLLLFLLCRRSGGSKTRSLDAATVGGKPPEVENREKGYGDGQGNGTSTNAAAVAAGAAAAKGEGAAGGKKLVFFGEGAAPFDLEDLLRASAEVLGKGAFGTAYKAVLEMGTTVAVKRLKDVTLSEREFREKIEAVGAMDHPKLVPLRAYYFSKDEKLLVYEYMPMGSLSALLHGNRGSGRTTLNWEARTGIALEAARGIEYIHSTSPLASHGNIKSSNILLTKSYEGRVSDHGLTLLVGPPSNPTRVAGYRAPEVTDPRKVSQKADVYSFGVLLLELLTGKAPAHSLLNEEGVNLPIWVQSVVREEWTTEVFDMELLRYNPTVEEDMVQLLQLAIDCTAQYPDKRPSISEIVIRIEEIRKSSLVTSFQDQQNNPQNIDDRDGQSSRRADSTDVVKLAGAES